MINNESLQPGRFNLSCFVPHQLFIKENCIQANDLFSMFNLRKLVKKLFP